MTGRPDKRAGKVALCLSLRKEMPKTIVHRGIRIVTLAEGETILAHCRADDIVLMGGEAGWWVYFVGDDGEISGYEAPFENYDKALWTAKAAAEFAAE